MDGADWDSIERSGNGYPPGKPNRDIAADDGRKITLGMRAGGEMTAW